MASDCAIQPLDLTTFPSPDDVANPGFTDLFAELVGDAGTPADGFEDDLAIASALLDSIDGALNALGGADGGTLDDTFAEILTVDPQEMADLQAQHAAALPAGDQAETDLGNLLAAAGTPAPSGGGGGGGGSGGGGGTPVGCVQINVGKVPRFTGGLFTHGLAPVVIHNTTGKTLTVTGTSWAPSYPTLLYLTQNIVGTRIPPGGSLPVTIVYTGAGDGPISSRLTIQTDGPDPQPCVDMKYEIVNNPVTPTSGPGGPQPF
jgi:hypothetical protein